MKEELVKLIESIKVNSSVRLYDEAATKQAVILPFVQLLFSH